MTPRNIEVSEEMRAQSHAALMRAAREVFARQGYFNCRISDIAKAAGMSQGNVYWYFEGKEALLRAVLTDGFDTFGDRLAFAAAQPGSALQKIEILIDEVLDFAGTHMTWNSIMLSLLGHGGAPFFSRLGIDMGQTGLGYTRSVASIVAQGQSEGSLPEGIDPTVPAMLFFALFNGLNLTYGEAWTQLPRPVIRSAVLGLLGARAEAQP